MCKSLAAVVATLVSSCLAVPSSTAAAQPVPLPPQIRIVVPAAPGSSTDVLARAVAAQLGPRTGSTIIVDYKPGASTMIGAGAVAKSPRDGSVLLINSTTLITTPATMRTPPFDVVNDLTPVALLAENPLVVGVSLKTDIKTPAELIAAARAAPDAVTHGTTGVGSIAHVVVELLNDAAKVQFRHIPYKGAALALVDLSGGTIDMMMATHSTLAPGIRAGRVRPIAVTSAEPSPAFPGLPTLASVVPGFKASLWVGIFAPGGTPGPVVQRLNREINEIAKSKELREIMQADGGTPLPLTPEEAGLRVREEFAAWKKLAARKNIVAE